MKKIIWTLSLLSFISCNNSGSATDNNIEKKELKSVTFINNFISNHPDWDKNNILEENTNDTFRIEVTKQIKNGLLDDFPLELGNINEYSKGKFAAIFNSYYQKNIEYCGVLCNIKFDVVGLINDSLVKKLQKDKKYILKGTFKKYLKNDFTDYMKKYEMVNLFLVNINRDVLTKEVEICLGVILLDISNVEESASL